MNYSASPKIIILGIDALEYNLVKEWRLKNIMQKTYCKMDLSDYKVIVTPPIWGSMLTGKIDEEIIKIWEKAAEIADFATGKQKWWAKLGIKILPYSTRLWIWKNFFEKRMGGNPLEITANYINEKKETNIFQFFEKPWTNGIPSYGRLVSDPTTRQLLKKALNGEKIPFRDYVIKNYRNDKSQLFFALDKQEFDFIFWYTTLLDHLGHVYIKNPLTFMKYYLEINEVIGKVRERCRKSCIYVVSDHGMEAVKGGWGMHSDHAFFSSNTGERIDKPFHLYDLISKHRII